MEEPNQTNSQAGTKRQRAFQFQKQDPGLPVTQCSTAAKDGCVLYGLCNTKEHGKVRYNATGVYDEQGAKLYQLPSELTMTGKLFSGHYQHTCKSKSFCIACYSLNINEERDKKIYSDRFHHIYKCVLEVIPNSRMYTWFQMAWEHTHPLSAGECLHTNCDVCRL
jgi:hypothetical protein